MMGIWKLCVLSIISMSCISSTVLSLSSSQPQLKLEKQTQSQGHETALNAPPASPVHTLILCRHGNSIWNGGEPGTHETFTGWTDVPLSPKGVNEAKTTGSELASLHPHGITACFTSTLQRAKETAHYCIWAYGDKAIHTQPKQYICDYRLNERHYGALQGLVKAHVEGGLHGHDPQDVQAWRRSWYAVPPLLEEDDPRRRHECKVFANMCGGKENVPRGESLEMVARNRIRPFLEEKIHPILTQAAAPDSDIGACGLVVAHANSLRALIGVLCQVEKDASALRRLEALKIQTGVPLILQYRKLRNGSYQVCDIYRNGDDNYIDMQSLALTPDLPVWPLSCMPRESKKQQSLFGTGCSQGIRIDVI